MEPRGLLPVVTTALPTFPVCLERALAAFAPLLSDATAIGVFRRELVTLGAMGFLRMVIIHFSGIAASYIFAWRNSFKVLRINASSVSAKMVECETIGNGTHKQFICDTVSAANLSVESELAISPRSAAVLAFHGNRSSPEPAAGKRFWRYVREKYFEWCILASRHASLLWAYRLGLREAGNFVAARFHFTHLLLPLQSDFALSY
jgi:hypothetical protein